MPTDKQNDLAFEVRDSPISGQGAFAIRPIKKGERLIEYVGERIAHPVANERYDDDSMEEHHTFLFSVSSRTVIDATHTGNESRYINHSCDLNCESEVERGRVYIFSLRDIKVGEELHYDYAYERSGDETEKEEAQYRCLCGAKHCRGSIMEAKEDFLKRQKTMVKNAAARTRAKKAAALALARAKKAAALARAKRAAVKQKSARSSTV